MFTYIIDHIQCLYANPHLHHTVDRPALFRYSSRLHLRNSPFIIKSNGIGLSVMLNQIKPMSMQYFLAISDGIS